jgi:hypothetical protein
MYIFPLYLQPLRWQEIILLIGHGTVYLFPSHGAKGNITSEIPKEGRKLQMYGLVGKFVPILYNQLPIVFLAKGNKLHN